MMRSHLASAAARAAARSAAAASRLDALRRCANARRRASRASSSGRTGGAGRAVGAARARVWRSAAVAATRSAAAATRASRSEATRALSRRRSSARRALRSLSFASSCERTSTTRASLLSRASSLRAATSSRTASLRSRRSLASFSWSCARRERGRHGRGEMRRGTTAAVWGWAEKTIFRESRVGARERRRGSRRRAHLERVRRHLPQSGGVVARRHAGGFLPSPAAGARSAQEFKMRQQVTGDEVPKRSCWRIWKVVDRGVFAISEKTNGRGLGAESSPSTGAYRDRGLETSRDTLLALDGTLAAATGPGSRVDGSRRRDGDGKNSVDVTIPNGHSVPPPSSLLGKPRRQRPC